MSFQSIQIFCFVTVVLLVSICQATSDNDETTLLRPKRSYYAGYDMYGSCCSDDFWFAGRIIGMIIGLIILIFCCCLPCICLAGVWFAGWFGIRSRDQKKVVVANTVQPISQPIPSTQVPGDANYVSYPAGQQQQYSQMPRQYPIQVESSPRGSETSRVMMPGDQVIFSAEDRYYTSSTAPAGAHRPDTFVQSRY